MTATPQVATSGTDLEEYRKVANIVNGAFKDAIEVVLGKLRDPDTFEETVMELAGRQGIPREAVGDARALFNSFWKTCTGMQTQMRWLNIAGVPEQNRAYVKEFEPEEAPLAPEGIGIMWGFKLPFGIEFHT